MENVKEKEFKVREDLNDIVTNIRIVSRKTNYGSISECIVKFFNDEEVIFSDRNKVYNLLRSFIITGQTGYLKSKKLVEELKRDEEGNIVGTYICVKYELTNGEIYRLFPKDYTSNTMIKNYYDFYKSKEKEGKK